MTVKYRVGDVVRHSACKNRFCSSLGRVFVIKRVSETSYYDELGYEFIDGELEPVGEASTDETSE